MGCIKDTFLKLIKLIGFLFKNRNLVIVPFYISVRLNFSTKKLRVFILNGKFMEEGRKTVFKVHYCDIIHVGEDNSYHYLIRASEHNDI